MLTDLFDLFGSLWGSLKNPVSWFVYPLLLILVVWGWFLLRAARRVAGKVSDAGHRIRSAIPRGAMRAEDTAKLERCLPDLPIFREQWYEFKEGCVEVDGRLYNTISSAAFITDDALLSSVSVGLRSKFPIAHALPGTLTGIGILGTFLGVTLGLGKLSAHQTEVLEHIQPVIGALSSAFWTSIFGVLAALVFSLLLSRTETALLDSLYEFHEAIDRAVPRLTAERLLHQATGDLALIRDLKTEAEEARGFLQTVANDLAENLGSRFGSALEQHLAPALTKILETVELQAHQATATSTAQAQRFTDEMVARLTGSLSSSLDGMAQRFDASSREIGDAAGMLRGVVDHARDAIEGQRLVLSEGMRAIENAQSHSAAATDQACTDRRDRGSPRHVTGRSCSPGNSDPGPSSEPGGSGGAVERGDTRRFARTGPGRRSLFRFRQSAGNTAGGLHDSARPVGAWR